MLNRIKYELFSLLRNKIVVFWLMGFPVILGTLFFVAFGSLADSEQDYSDIPVAVIKRTEAPEGFDQMIKALSETDNSDSEEKPLFDIVTEDEKKAKELMEKGELQAIIYVDGNISLEVPEGAGIKSGIVKSVLDSFKSRYEIISAAAVSNPEKVPQIIKAMEQETNYICSESNSANYDPYVQYFYNLLAMSGLFGSMMGMYCAINHQANLSALGARVEISPVSKFGDIISSLIATLLIHNIFLNIASAYLVYILGIKFGVPFWVIIVVNLLSSVLGNSLGCFIGSIGGLKDVIKNAILLACSLGLCFLSGLMFGGMRLLIEESFPLFNRINPAALIVDCFYSLCVYGSYEKIISNIAILLIWCALLLTGSMIMTRKRKYKSI